MDLQASWTTWHGTQSFIYRPKSSSLRGRWPSQTLHEEEAGLLSAGAATGAEDSITPSRRRLASKVDYTGDQSSRFRGTWPSMRLYYGRVKCRIQTLEDELF